MRNEAECADGVVGVETEFVLIRRAGDAQESEMIVQITDSKRCLEQRMMCAEEMTQDGYSGGAGGSSKKSAQREDGRCGVSSR